MLRAVVMLLLVSAFSLFASVGQAAPDSAVYAASDYSALAPPGSEQASATLSPLISINSMFGTKHPAIAVIAYSGHIAAAPQRQDFP